MTEPASGTLGPLDVTGRVARLRALFDAAGPDDAPVDALLVTAPANIRWLSGFTGSAGLLLVTPSLAMLTTDGRYRTQSSQQLEAAGVGAEIEIHVAGAQGQREALVAASSGVRSLGLEADHVTWSGQRSWEELFAAAQLAPTRGLVESLRVVKDAGEVARMERAASIADGALAAAVPLLVAVGRPTKARSTGATLTEAQFAAALDHAMRERGAEASAFETIVASGANSAKPHARPGDRL
ncbi:MAG TPA: aminopeptidase P family N-terminal domain-containing protein, partial [Acidimicrobiales bacterium]